MLMQNFLFCFLWSCRISLHFFMKGSLLNRIFFTNKWDLGSQTLLSFHTSLCWSLIRRFDATFHAVQFDTHNQYRQYLFDYCLDTSLGQLSIQTDQKECGGFHRSIVDHSLFYASVNHLKFYKWIIYFAKKEKIVKFKEFNDITS